MAPGNNFMFCMDWAASNIVLDADRVHLDKLSIHSLLFLAVKDLSMIDRANRLWERCTFAEGVNSKKKPLVLDSGLVRSFTSPPSKLIEPNGVALSVFL